MGRKTTIEIRREDTGEIIEAAIANVTVTTLFAITDVLFKFRDHVRIKLFDFELEGDVAFVVSGPPRGVVIAFAAPPVLRASLVEILDDFEVIEPAEEEWGDETGRHEREELDEVPEVLDMPTLSTPAMLIPASDTDAMQAPPLADLNTAPVLHADGVTVMFESRDHFRHHYTANIMHGGLVVSGAQVALGTQKFFAISVPGSEKYTLSVRATYNGPDTVGFTIEAFPIHKARLAQLAGK